MYHFVSTRIKIIKVLNFVKAVSTPTRGGGGHGGDHPQFFYRKNQDFDTWKTLGLGLGYFKNQGSAGPLIALTPTQGVMEGTTLNVFQKQSRFFTRLSHKRTIRWAPDIESKI